jgi:hypothetical protein
MARIGVMKLASPAPLALLVLAGLLAGCREPVFELRRVVQAATPEALTPGQRAALGCDPCVRLAGDPDVPNVPPLVGDPRPELVLESRDLVRAEVRENPALTRAAVVYNVVLETRAHVRPELLALRERTGDLRVALSFESRVLSMVPTAIWPEYVFVARFRDRDRAEVFAQRFGADVVFVPHE